jgi:hypothetical protein
MITERELAERRDWAITYHQRWKAQIRLADGFDRGNWSMRWSDDSSEQTPPYVENIYSQSWQDKMATAGALVPELHVPHRQGTKLQQAESQAARRRRVYLSYLDRGRIRRNLRPVYGDWFHTGASFLMPWCGWQDQFGVNTPPAERLPYVLRTDPRQVYPIEWDDRDTLTHTLVIRRRRLLDLERQWGREHPTIARFRAKLGPGRDQHYLDEVYYFDTYCWAVGLLASMVPPNMQGNEFVPADALQGGDRISEFLLGPEPHYLPACPMVAAKRNTTDGRLEGALLDVIPTLATAHNFMGKLLDDADLNIYAPVVLDNIKNPLEYGPGAVLVGTGSGPARIEHARAPVNFEATQVVNQLIDQARNQAFQPRQRAGDPGASIVSAKGIVASLGSFNSELAWAQGDVEVALEEVLSKTAAFDETHCYGRKTIRGMEGGAHWTESYDPTVLFANDYRLFVSYGDASGLDAQNHLVRLGTGSQLGWMSRRTAAQKSGLVDDALQEQRDIDLEKLADVMIQQVIPAAAQQGDWEPAQRFAELIDNDKNTSVAAVLKMISELTGRAQPAGMPGAEGPPGQSPADVIRMVRSLSSGGIPGQAEGLPSPEQGMLPSGARRMLAQSAPGGTAT